MKDVLFFGYCWRALSLVVLVPCLADMKALRLENSSWAYSMSRVAALHHVSGVNS